jgi:ribosomal protein L39E
MCLSDFIDKWKRQMYDNVAYGRRVPAWIRMKMTEHRYEQVIASRSETDATF